MIELTAGEITRECGGHMTSGMSNMTAFTGISTDSRTTNVGDLFIAFPGAQTDGRAHIEQAVDRGAMGIIAQPDEAFPFLKTIPEMYTHITLIEVDDALKAYQDIARLIRRKTEARVVAVTGSAGKTTTKDMIASILSFTGPTVAASGNFNNELGLPATFTAVEEDTKFIVVEMGMRGPGQITELMTIARPHTGVITNIGDSHMELLGSRDNIAAAKAEMAEAMTEKTTLVLNSDDPYTPKIKAKTTATLITFGPAADVTVGDIGLDEMARASFTIRAVLAGQPLEMPVTLPVPGAHNVMNALAAAAAALSVGAAPSDVIAGLAAVTPSANRMAVLVNAGGTTILNDTYNASPAAMEAALATLAALRGSRKIAVLGDMLELGDISEAAHQAVGGLCAANSVDMLLVLGDNAAVVAAGATAGGLAPGAVFAPQSLEEACEILKRELGEGDVVLVKASRALGLERIVECIK